MMVRYGGIALLIMAVIVLAILPVATSFLEQWARRDIELRSQLIAGAVRGQIGRALGAGDADEVSRIIRSLASEDGVIAAGLCAGGEWLSVSPGMPAGFDCPAASEEAVSGFRRIALEGSEFLVGGYPIDAAPEAPRLFLLHDIAAAEAEGSRARLFLILGLAGVAFGGAALASLVAFLIMRRWTLSVRQAIEGARPGRTEEQAGQGGAVADEIRQMLSDLENLRRSIDAINTDWNPDTLRLVLANELPGAEVIVVSNREPYIHNRTDSGALEIQRPASGLVSALEPVTRACGGTWIAHGSGSGDRDAVDANDRVMVPPANPSYALRRIWLGDDEQDGYYYGFANEGLWPLCHIAFVRPVFREADWTMYRRVNRKFADAVVAEARRPDPIVLIQDYHLALAPRMIRERLPDATIITFWHIPWPNAETFGICPWREEIVDGMLGSSILGFHTQFHCNNFIETVDRFIESRIDREHDSITTRGRETFVRPYPISIEWPPAAMAGQAPVDVARREVRERFGLAQDVRVAVGIERFDYTKGILDRMHAVDAFLGAHPHWRGRFCFVQAAAPTRSKLASYSGLQEEAIALAAEINARHASGGFEAIRLVIRHHEPEEVYELFRAADLCIVSSLHDGMNLVAKEFVAARDDERGVLILSAFAGASRELPEALIVNPYDAHGMGEAILRALTMEESEQCERMRVMRDQVRGRNVYRWAGQMLLDAARLRKKQRILQIVERERRRAGIRLVQ